MSPIQQPVHILRKDAIHLWPEILVSVALLIAFAWSESQTWLPSDGTFNPASLALVILRLLIPVSWLILTSRLVHDEELVGDRQFWITRPYTWYSLLLSKILFIIVFICLPFLLMQAWLLHHAGLYPTLLIPAMLKNLVYIAAIFLLPLLVIAAVTATFVRYISSVLGGFLYLLVVAGVASYIWPEKLAAPYLIYYLMGAVLLLMLAALLLQYTRRKTLIARLLLVAVPLLFVVFAVLAPSNALSNHRYPDTSAGTLAFNSNPVLQQPAGKLFTFQKKVAIGLPVDVTLTGLPDRSELQVQRYRIAITGPAGFHYTSDWSITQASFSARQKSYVLPIRLPLAIYDRIHNDPVSIHLQLGTQVLQPGTPYTVKAQETAFPLPGHAACTVTSDDGTLECRFAFSNPTFQTVQATVHNGNCITPGPATAPAFAGLAPSLSVIGFSPLEITHTQLTVGQSKASLCAGTPTTFTPLEEGPYSRLTLDIPSITLDPYALRIPTKQPLPTQDPDPQQQP
jgi:hypothetical protein